MALKNNLYWLKLIIISFGLILVSGFIFIVVNLFTGNIKQKQEIIKNKLEICGNFNYNLPVNYKILKVTKSENLIIVELTGNNIRELWSIDDCNGKIVSKFSFRENYE